MTCSDRLSRPARPVAPAAAIVRSDYGRLRAAPGTALPAVRVPLRRARARAGRAARAAAAGPTTAAGSCWSPARPARARAGSCASSPPRPTCRAPWCSTAPATRSCARRTARSWRRSTSSRARSTRRRWAPRSGRPAASSRACSPTSRCGPASRPRPTRTRSATACTPRSPTCSAGVGQARPILLVLEDVHWADGPTLGLLRHLARSGARARVLLLATFRDTDVPDALSETLADLRRSEDVVRLKLAGLTGDEVAELVRADAGDRALDPRADRRQPVPGLRALARVRRHRRARHARERARGGQRAARAAASARPATCSSWPRRPGRSSSWRCCAPPPAARSARCWPRSTRRSTAA